MFNLENILWKCCICSLIFGTTNRPPPTRENSQTLRRPSRLQLQALQPPVSDAAAEKSFSTVFRCHVPSTAAFPSRRLSKYLGLVRLLYRQWAALYLLISLENPSTAVFIDPVELNAARLKRRFCCLWKRFKSGEHLLVKPQTLIVIESRFL